MGANYYWYSDICECCGRSEEPVHIGKSSVGWCFALHVGREIGIMSIDDWISRWDEMDRIDSQIRDEYDHTVTREEMHDIITSRTHEPWPKTQTDEEIRFLESNYGERGPNGLIRHSLGHGCVGHGVGTWDLIEGNFS